MEIQLTQGKVTFIDDKHADQAVYTWYAHKKRNAFYAERTVLAPDGKRVTVRLHRVIAERMGIVGPPDHIDRNGLNNRESNLRPDPNGRNNANREGWGSSGYKGVYWYEKTSKWVAKIRVDGGLRHLGCYTDPVEAAKAYDRAALEAFGEFAVLNFPHGDRISPFAIGLV